METNTLIVSVLTTGLNGSVVSHQCKHLPCYHKLGQMHLSHRQTFCHHPIFPLSSHSSCTQSTEDLRHWVSVRRMICLTKLFKYSLRFWSGVSVISLPQFTLIVCYFNRGVFTHLRILSFIGALCLLLWRNLPVHLHHQKTLTQHKQSIPTAD